MSDLTLVSSCDLENCLLSKWSNFPIECDWNRIYPKRSKIGLFRKNRWVFCGKTLIFFKMSKSGKFVFECILSGTFSWKCPPHLNCELSVAKKIRFENYGQYQQEQEFFDKMVSSFQMKHLLRREGAKHAGGNRQSYSFSFQVGCLEKTSIKKTLLLLKFFKETKILLVTELKNAE